MAKSTAKDLRSFITFALALKPALTMFQGCEMQGTRKKPGTSLTLTISTADDLSEISETEMASLGQLMAKYEPLKPVLDGILKSDVSVATCNPTVNFTPNVHYRLVRITEEQFRIAKEVAARLERIHAAHTANDRKSAKREYDRFHEFLAQQRTTLTGEFQGIQFTNAVATYGVGSVSADVVAPQWVTAFVIIEIYIHRDPKLPD